jgi:sulfate permease, SulP family
MADTIAAIEKRALHWPLTRWDVAGAFGDIGILFPIAIALISLNHMNPTAVFLTAGLAYVLAGAYFRIPMAVQPFKAVAAIALALQLSPSSISSAGLLMGILLAFIGLTNLVTPLARLFTLPIVRGIQLGLGLILVREGIRLALGAKSGPLLVGGVTIPAWEIALGGAAVLLLLQRSDRIPSALVLLVAGVLVGSLARRQGLGSLAWGPVSIDLLHPHASELRAVLVALVLPQFALTFGNSIVAAENTAQVLYHERARRVTARALSLSIGLMNLVSGMLTSAPTCHGSGGITAHYKFGARTQKSNYVIGAVCLLLALFGGAAVGLLNLIPTAILGVFLVYVGIQHGALIRDIVARKRALLIAVCVGLVSLAKTNLTYGFVAGFLLEGLFLVARRVSAGRAPAPDSEAVEKR